MSCVTLDGEVHPWALILSLLRVELPKPAVSAPVLPCKYLLLGDAASKTLGFLFYGVLLAVEGLLTFPVLLHKAPASPVSVVTLAPLQHDARGGLGMPSWGPPAALGWWELSVWAARSASSIHTSVFPLTAAASGFQAPWSCKGSANFPLFHPMHAPITALPKDLLLSGPFGSTPGLHLLFLLYWGYQGMSPAHQVWPGLAANLGGGSESSLGCGGHEETAAEHGATCKGHLPVPVAGNHLPVGH